MMRVLMFVMVFLYSFLPSQAEARRGFALVTHGDQVTNIGTLDYEQAELLKEATGVDANQVGFYYQGIGLFFIDLWTWDGEYCIYAGDNVYPLEKELIATMMGVEPSEVSPPFFYRFPPGMIILLVVGAVFVVARLDQARSSNGGYKAPPLSESDIEDLLYDARFSRAMEVYRTALGDPPDAESQPTAFDAAVKHLHEEEGLLKDYAQVQMKVLIKHLSAAG